MTRLRRLRSEITAAAYFDAAAVRISVPRMTISAIGAATPPRTAVSSGMHADAPLLGFGVDVPPTLYNAPESHSCSKARLRSSPARPAASASASPRAFAEQGADVMLNGFGDAAEIETLRAELPPSTASRSATTAPTCRSRTQIGAMMGKALAEFGNDRHPRQQRRHPARRADRRVPGRQVGRRSSRSTCRASFHLIRAVAPGDEGEEVGPDHQHRLGARAGREPVQVGVRRGQARHRRPHEDGRARSRRRMGITMNAICPGYVWTPLVEKQIPDTAKARGLTEAQVISDVLLHAQPTKQFVQVERGRGARGRSSPATPPHRSPARSSRSTAAGPRSNRTVGSLRRQPAGQP